MFSCLGCDHIRAPKCHWDIWKYGTSKFMFLHVKEVVYFKIICNMAHILKKVCQSCPKSESIRNVGLNHYPAQGTNKCQASPTDLYQSVPYICIWFSLPLRTVKMQQVVDLAVTVQTLEFTQHLMLPQQWKFRL